MDRRVLEELRFPEMRDTLRSGLPESLQNDFDSSVDAALQSVDLTEHMGQSSTANASELLMKEFGVAQGVIIGVYAALVNAGRRNV